MADKLRIPSRPWDVRKEHGQQEGRTEKTGFYSTQPWLKLRNAYRLEHPFCEECLKGGKYIPMYIVDHKVPIREGGDPLSWDNLQSLCNSCHNKKSGQERHHDRAYTK